MHKHLIAVDIDLGRVTAVSNRDGVLADKCLWTSFGVVPCADLVLLEVAGPVVHRQGTPHSFLRWMTFNAMLAGDFISDLLRDNVPVLVSPSTDWTLGYEEKKRHAIAGILANPFGKYAESHDVRECRAMLYFYQTSPDKWVTPKAYLEKLCTSPKNSKKNSKTAKSSVSTRQRRGREKAL